jgi:hypothetical protein
MVKFRLPGKKEYSEGLLWCFYCPWNDDTLISLAVCLREEKKNACHTMYLFSRWIRNLALATVALCDEQ